LSDATLVVGRDVGLVYHGRKGRGDTEVLRDVNFSVPRGSIAAIIGPSGCGKTTLLNCIGGLLKPNVGSLTVDGKEPGQARKERYFGLIPQDASLFEWKTVYQNIELPFRIFGPDASEGDPKEGIEKLIKLVGLEGFEGAYPSALSGGMKQRVSLARALSFSPAVLLMDEPFGALDAQTREHMNVEVVRIWSEVKNTVVLITHDITEAVLLSDRVFVMGVRPSSIHTVVEIDIPRPRGPEVLDSPRLHEYVREIRHLLATR
jgi:NitT/TauT family transport system ATP-binding protein